MWMCIARSLEFWEMILKTPALFCFQAPVTFSFSQKLRCTLGILAAEKVVQ